MRMVSLVLVPIIPTERSYSTTTQPQASWKVSEVEKLRIQSTGSAGYIDSIGQDLYFRAGSGGTTKRMMITTTAKSLLVTIFQTIQLLILTLVAEQPIS